MDTSEVASGDRQPVSKEIRDGILEPFIAATFAALGEIPAAELVVKTVYRAVHCSRGDISALLTLTSANQGTIVLSFPQRTAAALAREILAGVTEVIDDNLIRDCVGEIANVVAGQAKAMLAGTPYQFTFSVPTIVVGTDEFRPSPDLHDHRLAVQVGQRLVGQPGGGEPGRNEDNRERTVSGTASCAAAGPGVKPITAR